MYNPRAYQFYQLVKTMRDAQRNYFATRDRQWLDRSKELERQVDDVIAKTEQLLTQRNQAESKKKANEQ